VGVGGRTEKHSFEKVEIGGVGFCHSPTELPTEFRQLLKKRHSVHIIATDKLRKKLFQL